MKLFIIQAVFATTAWATPSLLARDVPPPPPPAPAPASAGEPFTHIYLCSKVGFDGTCSNEQVNPSQCYNAPDALKHKIRSAGPDEGYFCTAYPNPDCKGKAFPFVNPGIWDLGKYNYADKMLSYRCDELSADGSI